MRLSPRWRGLWGTGVWVTKTPPGLPLDYPTPDSFMTKAIVMMTDGSNQWNASDYNAYGRLAEGRLGTTNGGRAGTEIDSRMATLCTRIKATGITIYTITLSSGGNKDLFRRCASTPGQYFHAPSASDLRTVFRTIGSQLANLRLEN